MPQATPPPSLVEGTLVMQVCLILIVGLGTWWATHHERQVDRLYHRLPSPDRYLWTLFLLTSVPVGMLVFSDAFANAGRPLFGAVSIAVFRWQTAVLWVFLVDIVCIGALVGKSGGSYRSPFTPVYFILPPMAFFLREPGWHILLYVGMTVLFFSLGLVGQEGEGGRSPEPSLGAYWLVSVACLVLATLIGYLTRAA